MSYIDPTSSVKVVDIYPIVNRTPATYSPSYNAGTGVWEFAIDVRAYMRAVFIVAVETVGTGATLDLKFQQSASDTATPFSTWADSTQSDGSAAALTQYVPANDNNYFTVAVDCSRTQNALGIEAVVASSGATRARFGVYAILFPYDTSNAVTPDMEI